LEEAYEAIVAAFQETVRLQADSDALVELIKEDLRNAVSRSRALMLLEMLPPSFSARLIPELVDAAESAKHAGRARGLLARMPARIVRQDVGAEVLRHLEADGADDGVFRRMAELLEYLGLGHELAALVELAAESEDADTRDVASDYQHQGQDPG